MIGLDASIFSLQNSGGVSRYFFELLRGFAQAAPEKFDLVFYPGKERNQYLTRESEAIRGLARREVSWLRLGYPLWPLGFRLGRYDLVHSPYFNLPHGSPNVLTVHDLIFLDEPRTSGRAYLRWAMQLNATRRAQHFICVSRATQTDLLRHFPFVKEGDTTVIYHGVSPDFSISSSGLVREKPYLLYLGARQGYKNFEYALKSFAHSRVAREWELLVVGGGALSVSEREAVATLGVANRVVPMADTADKDLVALVRGAVALVYPSQREGFGMPLVEAMAAGCPVIGAPISSMGEIGGNAMIPLAEFTQEAFDWALAQAAGISRADWISRGLDRAAQFSWPKAVKETLEVYRRMGASI